MHTESLLGCKEEEFPIYSNKKNGQIQTKEGSLKVYKDHKYTKSNSANFLTLKDLYKDNEIDTVIKEHYAANSTVKFS